MYDIIIIGCGPAGMTSAVYAARANKKVLVLEKETIGGQMASAPFIENYPGYSKIAGSELANNMYEQVENLGVSIELEEVKEIIDGKIKKVITDCNTYETKSIIIATGSKYSLLGLPNEENLIGKGIHFCVACDGAFYKEKIVAVIGGGNSAIINAITLSDICKKVIVIQNLDFLTAEQALIDRINTKENVEIILGACVQKIIGEDELKEIEIKVVDGEKKIEVDGMFISIGLKPQSELVKDLLNINEYGYIEAPEGITECEGIFVAGDCRNKEIRQVTVATSDGTIAAMKAIEYLNNN